MARSKTTFKKGHEMLGDALTVENRRDQRNEAKRRNKERFLEALTKSLGIVSSAAKICGLSTGTHRNYKRDDMEYRRKVEDIEDMVLDYGESKLLELINEKNVAAVIFFLKTKGKKRGYIEQPGYEVPPDESEFKMPKIEIVDIPYEDVGKNSRRIENE